MQHHLLSAAGSGAVWQLQVVRVPGVCMCAREGASVRVRVRVCVCVLRFIRCTHKYVYTNKHARTQTHMHPRTRTHLSSAAGLLEWVECVCQYVQGQHHGHGWKG